MALYLLVVAFQNCDSKNRYDRCLTDRVMDPSPAHFETLIYEQVGNKHSWGHAHVPLPNKLGKKSYTVHVHVHA